MMNDRMIMTRNGIMIISRIVNVEANVSYSGTSLIRAVWDQGRGALNSESAHN